MINAKTSKNIITVCNQRTEELKALAQDAADNYWTLRLVGNSDTSRRHKSNLGCRVVSKGSQFTMTWFTNSYDKTGAEIKTYSTHLRKGRASFRYSDSVLRRVSTKWELEYVQEAEKRFATIREELSALAKIRRALLTQKRLEKKIMLMLNPEIIDW